MDTFLVSVLGITQIIKKTLKGNGIDPGEWTQLIAVVVGAVATYAALYYPEVWNQITPLLQALGVTGSVSLVKDFTDKKPE